MRLSGGDLRSARQRRCIPGGALLVLHESGWRPERRVERRRGGARERCGRVGRGRVAAARSTAYGRGYGWEAREGSVCPIERTVFLYNEWYLQLNQNSAHGSVSKTIQAPSTPWSWGVWLVLVTSGVQL
jgi:hypothetical protein